MNLGVFETEYKKLNKEQRQAVDTIDGPVMVVAGPGTGKTQVLALRIANILEKTDVGADSVLCLTFTNSGVAAMRERLRRYIGGASSKVHVNTFHTFALRVIEENYELLDLDEPPKLLDENGLIMLVDHILENNEWQHIKPRGDNSRYYRDLKSILSLLKREQITPDEFEAEIKADIARIKEDPNNISTRGESKGELKKEFVKKIESLERTLEVVWFYRVYEAAKKERNVFDFDDVLSALVSLTTDENVCADLKEKYLYVLIDEHQDSSGVQNLFLQNVWGKEEQPNIFVVGDDRQLIYGFGGASLAYFEGFKHSFGKAKLITLVENYRSTQNIIDTSHALLESSISGDKLRSNSTDSHPLRLLECEYERDEIIAFGLDVLKNKIQPSEAALLVPKGRHVKTAATILRDMGLKVSTDKEGNLFDFAEAQSLIRILRIVADPYNNVALAESFFDPLSGIQPIDAHEFIRSQNMREFAQLLIAEEEARLFLDNTPHKSWLRKLRAWVNTSNTLDVYTLVQKIGDELLISTAGDHDTLVRRVEVVRTILHLILAQTEKDKNTTLIKFLNFLDRLDVYNEQIPLATFGKQEGVRIMTLHASKGLEFDYVWIAHMDEGSFERGKRLGFTLPENIDEKVAEKDEEVLKRELYVAITRARKFCNISYASTSYTGRAIHLSAVVDAIPGELLERVSKGEVEREILEHNPNLYIKNERPAAKPVLLEELSEIVSGEFTERLVSVSMLNNFFECPWKWYFRNLLQLPEPENRSLVMGNLVHGAIDKILKSRKKPSDKELMDFVSGDKEASHIVKHWVEEYFDKLAKSYENEKSVSVKDERFPELTVYGKIDLVEKIGEESARVTDFKTGTPKKKSDIEKPDEYDKMSNLMRQLTMYSYLLKQSPKWNVEVSESRLLFLEAKDKKEEIYQTHIDDETINLLVADIMEYRDSVASGKWVSRECHFKSYGKQDAECGYCKMAKIYQ